MRFAIQVAHGFADIRVALDLLQHIQDLSARLGSLGY
jgi:hypothetical protein